MTNIATLLRSRMSPGAVAFEQLDGSVIRYDAFGGWIDDIARAVASLRPGRGRRVAVSMPRSPLGLALFLGTITDNICCPMGMGSKAEEMEDYFESARADLLIAGPNDAAALEAAEARRLPALVYKLDSAGSLTFDTRAGFPARGDSAIASSDPFALLLQTSGTTSKPKTVLLTHSQILATAGGIVRAFALSANDICLNPMPFNHGHGLITAGLSSLLAGSRSVCLPSFSAELFSSAFSQHRPTWFTGSPAMHIALLDRYKWRNEQPDNAALRFFRSSSAPLPPTIIGDLEALFQAPLIETYGLTETATMIVTNPLPPGLRKVGSVGLPCSGAEVKAITQDGRTAAANEEGELLVRGPSIITHYGDTAADDPDNFTDGWLRTGDIGFLDADGYIFICGRTKELIKRGGLSVYPNEVDAALLLCPGVADAATFSIPHRTLGEEVVSAVVLAGAAKFDEAELRHDLLSRLSSYKVPSAIVHVDAIVKNDTGKIARREMSRQFSEALRPRSVEPTGLLEQAMLAKWRELLRRDDIGVTDNLFLFGADPLLADRFRDRSLGEGVPLERGFAFRHPTVREQVMQLEAIERDKS